MRCPLAESEMRVIVLFPGALGDPCLLAPALAAMAARGARVELSIQRSLALVAAMLLPAATLGPPIDGAVMAGLFADQLTQGLREWLRGADRVHAWLARGDADGRVRSHFSELGIAAHMHAVPRSDGEGHVGEEYAAALGLAGWQAPIHPTPPATPIALPWRRAGSARVLLHPGAGARAKCWAADGFRRVADAWIEGDGEAAVLLGPAEEEDAEWWQAGGHELVAGLSIMDAAALIASAPGWIGNDSGMSHLAGTLGRWGVVFFGPTRPQRWRPLGGRLTTVEFLGRSVAPVARHALDVLGVHPPGHSLTPLFSSISVALEHTG